MGSAKVLDIQFKNLSYEIQVGFRKPKKQILKDLNGFFKSGELTAIMGPSGAGKSTLLNLLSGYQQGNVTGTIEFISSESRQKWNECKKQSCYIQQSDHLQELFTIQENMIMATNLKISHKVPLEYKQRLINIILEALNLSNAKNTKIGRLSGGQKKRLSIALELIDNPPIMLLDEPTTGLDSLASFQCISTLRILAKAGRTVVCTIHQPSAALYHMFDYIYLVADGHCMYGGKPDDTVSYFAQQGLQCPKYHNPADYMLEIVSREYGNHDKQLIMAAKKYCRRDETPTKLRIIREASFDDKTTMQKVDPPSEVIKFWVLLCRCSLLLYRDWASFKIKIISHICVSIVLGLLFQQCGIDGSKTISNLSYLIIFLTYEVYINMMPAVLNFPLEMAILKKEHLNNWYKLKTYYIALLTISLPIHVINSFVLIIFSYMMSSQPQESFRFLMFLMITILTGITSESIGLGLGIYFNPVNGTFFGAITTCLMLSLAGFLIFFNHMPTILYYISYANYLRFSYEGTVQALYGYNREKLECHKEYCHFQIPSMILKEMHMTKPMFWIDITVLFSWFVIVRTATYVSLKRKLSNR